MQPPRKPLTLMADDPRSRGLLDTSAVIEMYRIGPGHLPLPDECAVSTLTLAELARGTVNARTPSDTAARQELLLRVKGGFDSLPFDAEAARAFGRVCAATLEAGRSTRGARSIDLLIAATALAHGLPVYTCNEKDFEHLRHLIDIVPMR